jgi:hypothetical protein
VRLGGLGREYVRARLWCSAEVRQTAVWAEERSAPSRRAGASYCNPLQPARARFCLYTRKPRISACRDARARGRTHHRGPLELRKLGVRPEHGRVERRRERGKVASPRGRRPARGLPEDAEDEAGPAGAKLELLPRPAEQAGQCARTRGERERTRKREEIVAFLKRERMSESRRTRETRARHARAGRAERLRRGRRPRAGSRQSQEQTYPGLRRELQTIRPSLGGPPCSERRLGRGLDRGGEEECKQEIRRPVRFRAARSLPLLRPCSFPRPLVSRGRPRSPRAANDKLIQQ